jgi:hypothetical protein
VLMLDYAWGLLNVFGRHFAVPTIVVYALFGEESATGMILAFVLIVLWAELTTLPPHPQSADQPRPAPVPDA